jgi:phosphopantothenoylcysteine decarboxylase
MKILLGLTGSVASVLNMKLVQELQRLGEVEVILTERAKPFVDIGWLANHLWKSDPKREVRKRVWTDDDEWKWPNPAGDYGGHTDYKYKWEKNDPVLHINLRDQASVLVIAPCSANTLAKIVNGMADNLLTSVVRAWDFNRPLVIAPAMNTHMWNNPITARHLRDFGNANKNNHWIHPQTKMLACNTEGVGALANINEIVQLVEAKLRWDFPLHDAFEHVPKCNGIPQPGHPGAFLTKRKNHTHTGVDLYTTDKQAVHAVEDGVVVGIEDFTGLSQQSPWWEDTQCILIEGASGVVCYGEIAVNGDLRPGHNVSKGQFIGRVKRVLKPGKERPDIEGHSTSMLHMEIYKHGVRKSFEENPALGVLSDWSVLIDPTPFLMSARNRPVKLLYGHE